MLGIIGGTSLLFADLPVLEKQTVHTPFGPAEVLCGEFVLLLRHQGNRPPHRINYPANIAALSILGVDRVVAIGSAGSLKIDIKPGSMLIPTDYISTSAIPTIHNHAINHIHPALPPDLAWRISEIVPDARLGGIYVQTPGPRIETEAEVAMLAQIADVVGMTLASEATLSCELGIAFSAICTVDNYASGLGDETLTYEHILDTSRAYRKRTSRMVESLFAELG